MHRGDIRPPGDGTHSPALWRSYCPMCRTWWAATTEPTLRAGIARHDQTGRWPA